MFGVILAIVAVVVLLFTVFVPLVVLGLELILVLVLAVVGLGGRLLLGKPWTVRARSDRGLTLEWRAQGFRCSGRVRDQAADALARGERSPHPSEALPA